MKIKCCVNIPNRVMITKSKYSPNSIIIPLKDLPKSGPKLFQHCLLLCKYIFFYKTMAHLNIKFILIHFLMSYFLPHIHSFTLLGFYIPLHSLEFGIKVLSIPKFEIFIIFPHCSITHTHCFFTCSN